MKQAVLSVSICLLVLGALAGSAQRGMFGHFSDTEQVIENNMCSGTLLVQVSGGPIVVKGASPSSWYEQEWLLTNTGTREGMAWAHLKDLLCFEDAVGPGVATAEPEVVAEDGGWLGGVEIPGLGWDAHNLAPFMDAEVWFDGTLKWQGKLSDLVCQPLELGILGGVEPFNGSGGGWGGYFKYCQGSGTAANPLVSPFVAGQTMPVGQVKIWDQGGYLYVRYDAAATGWVMKETHLYVGKDPPEKLAPGKFPYKHEKLNSTIDNYPPPPIPIANGSCIYVAAHAEGTDGETAWAFPPGGKFKLRLHFPDIDEDDVGFHLFDDTDPEVALKCWDHWPTNAYMGDYCTFDLKFYLNQSATYQWKAEEGGGWKTKKAHVKW